MQSSSWLPLGAVCKADTTRLMMSSFLVCSLIDPRPEQHKDTTHFGGQEKRPKGCGDEKEQALWLTDGSSAMSGGVGGAYTPDARPPWSPSSLPHSSPPLYTEPASVHPTCDLWRKRVTDVYNDVVDDTSIIKQ